MCAGVVVQLDRSLSSPLESRRTGGINAQTHAVRSKQSTARHLEIETQASATEHPRIHVTTWGPADGWGFCLAHSQCVERFWLPSPVQLPRQTPAEIKGEMPSEYIASGTVLHWRGDRRRQGRCRRRRRNGRLRRLTIHFRAGRATEVNARARRNHR